MDEEKIYLKEDDYFNLCDQIENLDYKAQEYAPTIDELLDIIIPEIAEYYRFLIWIDETGIETSENKESRKIIRDILKERIILT